MFPGIHVEGIEGAPIIGQRRPTVSGPVQLHQADGGRAAVVTIVIMKGEPVGAVVIHDGGVAGADVTGVAFEKHGAAAVGHVDAGMVKIRSGDIGTATHANVVCAVHTSAAAAKIHEQVIVSTMLVKIGGLLRVAEKGATVVGHAVNRRIGGDACAGGVIQRHDEDAVRRGAERHPDRSVGFHHDGRINAVVGGEIGVGRDLTTGIGLDHFALVGPDRRSQRWSGDQPDGGIDGAPRGTGVIEIIPAIEVGDVRRPKIAGETADGVGGPRRRVPGKYRAHSRPVAQVSGGHTADALAVAINKVTAAALDQGGRIVQEISSVERQLGARHRQPAEPKGAGEQGQPNAAQAIHEYNSLQRPARHGRGKNRMRPVTRRPCGLPQHIRLTGGLNFSQQQVVNPKPGRWFIPPATV